MVVAVSTSDTDECQVSVSGNTDSSYLDAGVSGNLTFLPDGGTENPTAQITRWSTAQTVTVRGVDDNILDGNQTCAVKLDTSSPPPTGDSTYHNLADVTVNVTVQDNEVRPTLVLSASRINESGMSNSTEVTATLMAAAASDVEIEVSATAVSPAVAGDFELSANKTLRIAMGATTSTGDVTITAVDNDVDALDKRVTVSARSSGGNTVNPNDVSLTIVDDDEPRPTLVLGASSINESGAGNSTTVTATLAAALTTDVTLDVSVTPVSPAVAGDFELSTNTELRIMAGQTTSMGEVTITARDNDVDAPNKTLTVSATSSSGNTEDPTDVTLTIVDDDEPPPQVVLILTPAEIDESGARNASMVTATLSRASRTATTITVSASGTGFQQSGETLTIAANETNSAGMVTLTAVDDEEYTPDRRVSVSGRAENTRGVRQPAAVVLTIRDDDGDTDAVIEVLLPKAARVMADSRATAVRQRLQQADSGIVPETPSLTGLLARHGPSAQADDGFDWKRSLLPQAAFSLLLDADDNGGSDGIVVWGSGDYIDLDGDNGGVNWDGDVVSTHLGADRLLSNGLRVGLAASWSEAKFDYEYRNRKGEWQLEMTSAQPYLGWTTSGGIDLWASAGYGTGWLEIDQGRRPTQRADASMSMAVAGVRGPMYAMDGLKVSLRGEALYTHFKVDDNGDEIRRHKSDASRLRLAVEAQRQQTLNSGALISPRFELGVRYDGGDGETGTGLEVGTGVDYTSGRLGMTAQVRVANSGHDEWGANLSLAYLATADGFGLSFRLVPSYGTMQSGMAELWENGAPRLNSEAAEELELGGRMDAELGYGLKSPLGRGLLTLGARGSLGEDEGSICRLSGTVALDKAATLGLEMGLREPKSGATDRSLMLKAELRF